MNSGFSCLHLLGAGIPDVCHHAWLAFPGNKVMPVTRAVLSECVLDGKPFGKYKRLFLPLTGLVLGKILAISHLWNQLKHTTKNQKMGPCVILFTS